MQYVKIKDAIVEQIETGMLAAGEKLPSERKLAEAFDTTRVTLREALSLLESEGRIFREDRRGWFISRPTLKLDPSVSISFRELSNQQSRQGKTQVLVSKSTLANKYASALMALAPFSDIYQIERVRYLEGRPVCYVVHYVQPAMVPNLLEVDFSMSLTQVYRENYGLSYGKTQQRITTTGLQGDIAYALNATVGTPALMIECTNYDEQGRIVDASIEYWRHDAVSIESTITR
ncbi:phosphonate utilization transcriptional regulator PhnR [Vibrio sp. MarTm2]|uniref:phosphonate utilization transcriptional regulator PhnR n=1 Tax=Vibrio sp. MarTm2 TaxID=2998831 RepID=UPI0022CD7345|nr:phosphonate utilization transcriptional regulator PhnR [Vibrio sp. MarTm2]MDA0129420.1 phosphonate utilization transcriptional regulator PhnR [Vibrio sp. MarTm2]